jgi:hypothetical protein
MEFDGTHNDANCPPTGAVFSHTGAVFSHTGAVFDGKNDS